MKPRREDAVRVRRSRHLIFYWKRDRVRRRDQLIVRNYATAAAAVVSPIVCCLLDYCSNWKTTDDIQRAVPFVEPARVRRIVRQLVERSFLQQSNRAEAAGERAMTALAPWNPEAGFFHTITKDVRFWSRQESARRARTQLNTSPMPPPVKSYPHVPAIELPLPSGGGDFPRVARERRTWRRFAAVPVTIGELATLLGLSIGVQQWVRVGDRELALKTSPSGGARHPIEAYVVVRGVRGLRAGIYHYNARRHAVERLRGAPSAARIRAYMPNSGYFARASAVVFFTAVFERQLWRYPYSRAYRAALIEVGHVVQTFCLAATALNLAPFCLMALADSLIERDLGIDGISETVLYAAGVGRRPRGSSWAPVTRGTLPVRPNPRLA